jgi:hypothetical protein
MAQSDAVQLKADFRGVRTQADFLPTNKIGLGI